MAEENLKAFKERLEEDIPIFPVIALIQDGVIYQCMLLRIY